MTYPVRGQTYTLAEIETLELRDSPFLRIPVDGELYPTQTSHMDVRLVNVSPEWANSKWTYQYETDEWIPLFRFAGTPEEQAALVDVYEVPVEKRLFRDEREFMVTPKGFPWGE